MSLRNLLSTGAIFLLVGFIPAIFSSVQATGAQPSLEIKTVTATENTCERISGEYTVRNGGSATGHTVGVFAVLQAHVPPSRGGQAHFFDIKQVQLPDFALEVLEEKTLNYSFSSFIVPAGTNSLRVEIRINVAERSKTFISRSDSFKPPVCGGQEVEPTPTPTPTPTPGPTSTPTPTSESTSSNSPTPTSTPTPTSQLTPEVLGITQLPATGTNSPVILFGLSLVSFVLGCYLRKFSNKLDS